jgi:hypothetical protein
MYAKIVPGDDEPGEENKRVEEKSTRTAQV